MAEKSSTVNVRSALPADISMADIYSNVNVNDFVDLRDGLIRLTYYESILQDSVRVILYYADSGNTIEKDGKRLSALEGLPIVGQERVELAFEDNNENKIEFTKEGKNNLYVNKVTPITDDSTRSLVMLDLVSKEYILNEKLRLNTRFDGKISDHVKGILTKQTIDPDSKERKREKNYFDSEKELFIEETTNEYIFCGDNRKPFYTINWLSKKGVSGGGESADGKSAKKGDSGALGVSAGYFFWETSKGFHFRSIDWLVDKEMNPKKLSVIYTDTTDIGNDRLTAAGYDVKALAADKGNSLDIQKKLQMGAFSTRTVVFNPFDGVYQVIMPNAYVDEKKDKLKLAGENLPVMNKEFDMQAREGGEANEPPSAAIGNASGRGTIQSSKEFSRTQYMILDTGTLISKGSKDPKEWDEGTREQLTESQTKENFDILQILNQASMRYNQLFSSKISVTIPGDFSLHAGDSIFYDGPQLTGSEKKDSFDKKDGGLYIIADICHYITSKETFTKMNLVRESTGKKGTATEA